MLILAFDTTAAAVSVALWRDGAVLARVQAVMAQGQAEALMPAITRIMASAGETYAALDRVAVTAGPGSFTGVRVLHRSLRVSRRCRANGRKKTGF